MTQDLDPAAVTGTSSEAAEKATGKPWAEWMVLLDAAGGREMTHKAIVAHLAANFDVSPWWQQQIAVGYEQSRGLRAKHEMAEGYQISRSRTLAATAERVYVAWLDHDARRIWLPDGEITIRNATPHKSIRLAWRDDSRVEVRLVEKDEGRTTVTVQHNKLPDSETAEAMKRYWAAALDKLQAYLG